MKGTQLKAWHIPNKRMYEIWSIDFQHKKISLKTDEYRYFETDLASVELIQYSGVYDDHETEDPYNKLWAGDIVEITRDEVDIICEISYEICGFMLVSDKLDDGYEWLGDSLESLDGSAYLPGSKLLGNKFDNPELLEVERT